LTAGLARDYTPTDISAYATARLKQALTLLEKYSNKRRLPLALTFETWFHNPVVRAGAQIALFEVLHAQRGRPSRKPIADATLPLQVPWIGLSGLATAALERALLGKPQKRPESGRPNELSDDDYIGYADLIDDVKVMLSEGQSRKVLDREAVEYVRKVLERIGGTVNCKRPVRSKFSYLCNLLKTARNRRKKIAAQNTDQFAGN
jgi:hypothetical protein